MDSEKRKGELERLARFLQKRKAKQGGRLTREKAKNLALKKLAKFYQEKRECGS